MAKFLISKIGPDSLLTQQFLPASTFDPARDIHDLTGKVILVTGGNCGIGYHTVKALLLKNAKVYLACRSLSKGEDAREKLKQETGGKVPVLLKLDLADLTSIRAAAEEFLRQEERLDVLFNNAGVMNPPVDMLTAQGYDLQFGTNVLGHYFFTKLLLPALESSTTYFGTKARVVHTSSNAHLFPVGPTGIDWATLRGGPERDAAIRRLGFTRDLGLYGSSKLGNVLVSNIMTRHHGGSIISCSVHPGGLRSEIMRHTSSWQRLAGRVVFYPAHYGALTQLWAGTSPDGERFHGKYLYPWARFGKADPRAANETTQDELLKWMEEQIKEF